MSLFKKPANLSRQALDFSSSGDNTIISATTGETIRVHALAISFASAATLIVKSGSNTIGTFYNVTSLVLDPVGEDAAWFVTNAGEALIFNIDGAINSGGILHYVSRVP